MPIFSVKHTIIYRYSRRVRFGEHRLMFSPRDSFDERLLDHADAKGDGEAEEEAYY